MLQRWGETGPRALLACGHHTEPSAPQNVVSVTKLGWVERELQAWQWVPEHLSRAGQEPSRAGPCGRRTGGRNPGCQRSQVRASVRPSVTASERSWAGPSLSSSHSFRDWAPSMRAGGRAGHPGASPAHRALQAAPPCAPWFGVARAPGPRQQRGQGLPRRTPPRLCVLAPWWAHPRSGLSTVRPGPWDAGAGLRGKVFILRL